MTAADVRVRADDPVQWQPSSGARRLEAWFPSSPDIYYMLWGDGTQSKLDINEHGYHVYDQPGAYYLRAKTASGRWLGHAQTVVRPTHDPNVTLGPHPDSPELYAITFGEIDDTGIMPRFRVNWRDGKPGQIQESWGIPGNRFVRYLAPGKHIVSVYELTARTQKNYRDLLVDHSYNPDFTLTTTGREVTLTVTKATEGKALVARWGDATAREPVSGTSATHTYPSGADATYLVQLGYADASSSTTKEVAISGGSP